jgi:hypothetical protein
MTMAYSHSFAPEFYGDVYEAAPSDRPTNVADALASMGEELWDEMAREVFNVPGDRLDIETVMAKIEETDTVGNLDVPVSVWIDSEGFYAVDVY